MSMDGDEYQESRREKGPNWLKVFLPLMGLILAAVSALFAFVLSEPAYQLVRQGFPQIPEAPEIHLVVGIIIFAAFIFLIGATYAAFAPKPLKIATEKELDRERQQKAREAAAAKRRRKEMREKMKSRNKEL